MGETLTIGLTKDQRELLLQGLRFVRSSVLLELRDYTSETDEDRRTQLQKIESLASQLSGSRSAGAATSA